MNRQQTSLTLTSLLILALSPALFADSGLITTIAGTGVAGTGGVGGPAANAQLTAPGGICLDSADNLFIADSVNNRVVRVDSVTGILTLVAGNGAAASGGDGGPATLASINYPYAVALDAAGNLFISEYHGQRIRRVDAQTGIITAVAGNGTMGFSGDSGAAVNASLSSPGGIALDANGNLYVADQGNFRVRGVNAQTGIIMTIAGNGVNAVSADGVPAAGSSLARPIWVSFIYGSLLIGEFGSNRIRWVSFTNGILGTVAGNGSPDFNGDGMFASSAGIGVPSNVVLDQSGNLLFADGSGRVRRLSSTGIITTVAGNGSGPHGIYSTGGGGGFSCISTVAGDNGPATNATLDGPVAVQITHSGDLLISDYLDCRVRRVDLPSPNAYTTIGLNSTAATIQPGQAVTYTAMVSPINTSGVPTGTIAFVDALTGLAPTTLGTVPLSGGAASLSLNNLSTGSHQIVAYYGGDSQFNGSGSPAIPLTVTTGKLPPIIALSASQNPTTLNNSVTFTATVTPPAGSSTQPIGSVEFDDGLTKLGTAGLVNGIAQFSFSFPAAGNHAISAIYLGDANYLQVSSAALNETVNAMPTTVSLATNLPAATYGQPVQFTASVSPAAATGTVNFLDLNVMVGGVLVSSMSLGTATLSGGTAVLTVSNLTAGTHTIKVSYLGDGVYADSMSATISQSISQATPALTIESSLNPSPAGQTLIFTGTIAPVSQGGTLSILDGQTVIPGVTTWRPGQGTVTTGILTPGRHSITAVWSGDANVASGSSTILTQTVQAATTLTVAAGSGPFPYGQPVTLTATVSPNAATGTVQFTDGATPLGTATISGGTASLALSTLGAGNHQINAAYAGDGVYLSSNGGLPLSVDKAAASVALSSSLNPAVLGQSVTLTAAVVPNAATGTVQFLDGTTALGTVAISGGAAALVVSSLTVGAHTVTAVYSGDSNYTTRTSAALTQTVSKAASSVTLASSQNPSTFAQLATFSATVSPAGVTGTVQFLNGATLLGSASLVSGQAQFSLANLPVGPDSLTAVYSGDASYAGSTSVALVQTVNKANSTTTLTANPPSPSTVGQAVNFTASVAPSSATGSVQFLDGASVVGTAIVSNGVAVFSTSTLSSGQHSITALYSGDGSFNGSQSAAVAQQVLQLSTSTILSSGRNPSTFGTAVTLVANVSPSTATGTVQFFNGPILLGSGSVIGSQVQLSLSSLPAGSDSLTAVFGGNSTYAGSTSAALLQTVNKANSTTTLAANPASQSSTGQTVTFTASVAPAGATGSVQFLDGRSVIGTATLANGAAVFSTSALVSGNHSIAALYLGDSNVNPRQSATLAYKVKH